MTRTSVSLALATAALLCAGAVPTVRAQNQQPERAIRRDIPITDMMARALQAGTRDSSGAPGTNYWQLRTDYRIETRLEPATSMVTGSERVIIHNTSPEPLPFIVLRLDQNIFRENVARAETVSEITGGMTITRLTIDGVEVDLNAAPPPRRFGQPAAPPSAPIAVGLEQTVARLLLPEPVAPGAQATLTIDWSFRVPRVDRGRGLRMGAWPDSLFQVAQWYPRVAKFDDLRGWDAELYLGPSEFYNNFGSFDVSIDVPAGWIVGATGVLQNPEQVLTPTARERLARVPDSDDVITIVGTDERGAGRATAPGTRLVWHFVADTVNDFAWSASDRYIWDATRADVAGRMIPIHMLYTPNRAQSWARAPGILRHALEFYSALWMPYAFPQLTMADGPETGMEYPMFIMSGVGAADHEVGHEWWPMMVGTNETWYGFMDEGFNQYMNILSSAHRADSVPSLDGLGQRYGGISGNEYEAPLMWNANYGGPLYSFQAYGKAPLMLSMLGGMVGDSAVWHAMSDYSETWRFRHPSPWDYAFFMSDALGRDLGWFWYSWLFTTDAVDGSIQDVRQSGTRTTVVVRQDGQMPAPVVLRVQFAPTGPALRPMDNATMLDNATALVRWPVDVWFDGRRTFNATLDFGGRAIESITLDPFGRFPDADASDNTWPRATAEPPQPER
jgi:hypothetical protein